MDGPSGMVLGFCLGKSKYWAGMFWRLSISQRLYAWWSEVRNFGQRASKHLLGMICKFVYGRCTQQSY